MREVIANNEKELSANHIKALGAIFNSSISYKSPFLLIRYPSSEIFLASKNITSESTFTFSPFYSGETLTLQGFDLLKIENTKSYVPFERLVETTNSTNDKLQLIEKQQFISNVSHAKTLIEKGHFKKVVLSKAKSFTSDVNAFMTFINLEKKYSSALIYCFYHPLCGTWIGASPEKLLERDLEDQYHIHSLAGTKKISEKWTEKEIVEQQIVTDYITSRLRDCQASHIEIEGPMDYEYGEIKHLKSSIHFHSEKSVEEIVQLIHPTPAVCGMPLQSAKQFILDYEGYDRSYYTGFIGLKDIQGIHDTYFVNLRCMQVNDDNAYIYTGAGIVADSDPEMEWEEVEAKAKTLIDCISTNG